MLTITLSMVSWFVNGGPVGMSVLTIILVLLLFAAWKAPAWVKEIGIMALLFGIFYQLLGIYQMLGYIQNYPDVSYSVLCGGLKVSMAPVFYGMVIYMISLVLRIIQKPRVA
jgi:hypothetical protein